MQPSPSTIHCGCYFSFFQKPLVPDLVRWTPPTHAHTHSNSPLDTHVCTYGSEWKRVSLGGGTRQREVCQRVGFLRGLRRRRSFWGGTSRSEGLTACVSTFRWKVKVLLAQSTKMMTSGRNWQPYAIVSAVSFLYFWTNIDDNKLVGWSESLLSISARRSF